MKTLHINARRWFDRRYGNTYFTAQAYVDGKLVADLPMEYGYGDHCIDRAWHETAMALGLENAGTWPSKYCRENGIQYVCDIADVSRQRDLHNCGR